MSRKTNVQQRLKNEIYKPFIGVLGGKGVSIADGLEQAIELWMERHENEKKKGKK